MDKDYKTIRRVTITCGSDEVDEVFPWASRNGYSIKYSGPKIVNLRAVPGRFKLIAEKEAKGEECHTT